MGFFLTLLVYAAVFVLAELLRPKPDLENAQPAGLGDFNFPTAQEDRKQPLLWGTKLIQGPNVVWYGDLVQDAITEEVKTSLWSSQPVVRGFKYSLGIQFALCRGGSGMELLSIQIGEEEVWSGTVSHGGTFTINEPELFGGDDLGNGGIIATGEFFDGNLTQTASSYLSSFQSEGGDTPAYRGTCYIVPSADPFYLGNSTSIKKWAFECRRIPNGLSLITAQAELNSGNDANPMNVIYEILTDTEWGMGIAASDIDTSDFSTAAATLATENNGFSMLLDSDTEAAEMLRIVEKQIDGVVYFDQAAAKYKIKLARADYTLGSLTLISEANAELRDFGRGAWEDTTNEMRTQFAQRSNNYRQTFGLAQDTANIRIQETNITATKVYPGISERDLANDLAWRDLRTTSYPLAKATVAVDREFYATTPAQVYRFSWDAHDLGVDVMAMRVTNIDYGELDDGKIVLDMVEDVFYKADPSFSAPTDTDWEAPTDTLSAFPSAEQIAFEAPRAIVARDPFSTSISTRIWCGARKQGNEVSFNIVERNAAGVPSGAYAAAGSSFKFLRIGELNAALDAGSATPFNNLIVTPTPDSQTNIIDAFTDSPDVTDMGTSLINLIKVGNEFMFVTSATTNAANVELDGVYRAALDSVQEDHASGTDVFLIFVGGNLATTGFPGTNNVDIKLLPRSLSDTVAEGSATTISLTMANRILKPYPPSRLTLNSVEWDSTNVSLEGTGSDGDDYAIDLELNRRDWRTANGGNEITALSTDAADIFSDYPTANSSEHDIEVRDDPGGSNTLLFTETSSAQDISLLRKKILRYTDGVLPSDLGLVITARHTVDGTTYESTYDVDWDFTVSTALTGDFNFGALDTAETSNQYTADAAGTHSFSMPSSLAADVEYRIDTGGGFGSWTQLIPSGNTSGNIAGVAVSDVIEIRHQDSTADLIGWIDMSAPGAGTDAYAVPFS